MAWSIYGTTSSEVDNVSNPNTYQIADFMPTDHITEADFNNLSNTFLAYDMGRVQILPGGGIKPYPDTYNPSSKYKNTPYGTNFLGFGRVNFLTKVTKITGSGSSISYEYKGNALQWGLYSSGVNSLQCFRYNAKTYDHPPACAFNVYSNNEIERTRVKLLYLIATKNENNNPSYIGVVRPLWSVDFTGIDGFQEHPIQFFLGQAIDHNTIDAWLEGVTIEEPDAPSKPVKPEDADQHAATTANFTWENNFRIMNWNAARFPKLLIDGGVTWANFLTDYAAYNDDNDPAANYHMNAVSMSYINFGSDTVARITNIHNNIMIMGHDVSVYWNKGTGRGKFSTHDRTIDDEPSGNTSYIGTGIQPATEVDIGAFKIDYSSSSFSGVNSKIFKTDTGSFSISANYPNNTQYFETDFLNSFLTFVDCCIIRYGGHYYLGGYCVCESGNNAKSGLAVICRMDNLQSMPGYGGSNPGDPGGGDGLNGRDMDNTFGNGTGGEPNPTTDKEIDNNIGDSEEGGTGSAYDEDGNPIDPGSGSGTGEKNSNPVDQHQIPNSHDGSMGNGTGDPHEGDTQITSPDSTLPTGTSVPGTVTGSGILAVFTPSQAELQAFTAEMLSNTVLDSIKNYFTTNPMDGIFSLHIVPYSGFSGVTSANPRIGTHNFSTALTLADTEFITVDYGEIEIKFSYDGYENYAPYSDAKIFLPYIGTKDIDINAIQGCTCKLKYNVSLVTGDIYAFMYCQWSSKWGQAGVPEGVDHLLYSWQGNCAATIPLSHLDSTNYISGAMQIAGGITSIAAGAAAANPFSIPGGVMGVANGVAEIGRTQIITSGNISGMAAFMGCKTPYIILSRPVIAYNNSYNHYLGMRSNAIQSISQLRQGTYTVMRNVDLSNIAATSEELNEIESILKGGFYA